MSEPIAWEGPLPSGKDVDTGERVLRYVGRRGADIVAIIESSGYKGRRAWALYDGTRDGAPLVCYGGPSIDDLKERAEEACHV